MKAELADWRDKAMRAVAEAENTKRRSERESNRRQGLRHPALRQGPVRRRRQPGARLQAAHGVGLADSSDPAVKNLILGIEMTEKALQSAFERQRPEEDRPRPRARSSTPHSHQAMMEQDDPSTEPGAVIQTMQAGYELFGRNLRPAMGHRGRQACRRGRSASRRRCAQPLRGGRRCGFRRIGRHQGLIETPARPMCPRLARPTGLVTRTSGL